MNKRVKLTEILSLLEGERPEKPYLVIDYSKQLEVFMKYKGLLVELNKVVLRSKLKGSIDEEAENLRAQLVLGLQKGYWISLALEDSSQGHENILSEMPWYNKAIVLTNEIYEKDNLLSSKILKKDEDQDLMGTPGFYTVHRDSKLLFLYPCESEETEKNLSEQYGLEYTIVIVEA